MGFIVTLLISAYLVYGIRIAGKSRDYWAGLAWKRHPTDSQQTRIGYVHRRTALTVVAWPAFRRGIMAQQRRELGR